MVEDRGGGVNTCRSTEAGGAELALSGSGSDISGNSGRRID